MKVLSCEMCGSSNLVKENGLFVCKSCGTKYSVEEAKKMMIEGTVSVKVDSSEELKKLFIAARRARDTNNATDAENYYNKILLKEPNNWESLFYVTYFKAQNTTIASMASSLILVTNSLESVLDLVSKLEDQEEKDKAISEITIKTSALTKNMAIVAKKTYLDCDYNIRYSFVDEFIERILTCANTVDSLAILLQEKFGDKYNKLCAALWKQGIDIFFELYSTIKYNQKFKNYIYSFEKKVKTIEPNFSVPRSKLSEKSHEVAE